MVQILQMFWAKNEPSDVIYASRKHERLKHAMSQSKECLSESRNKRLTEQKSRGIFEIKLRDFDTFFENCDRYKHGRMDLVKILDMLCAFTLLADMNGYPRTNAYINMNLKLGLRWFFVLRWMITIALLSNDFIPSRAISSIRTKHNISRAIRAAALAVGFIWGAGSVSCSVPEEAMNKFSTAFIAGMAMAIVVWVIVRSSYKTATSINLLRSMRHLSLALFLWTAFLWVEGKVNVSGQLMAAALAPNENLRVCSVYVATFKSSPRLKNLVPAIRDHVRGLEGAKWFVYNGTKMPKQIDKRHSDPIIRNLLRQGYLSPDAVEEIPCPHTPDEKCLRVRYSQ